MRTSILFYIILSLFFSRNALANCSPPSIEFQTQYCYDALGRLIHVFYGDVSETEYKYDAAGNRISVETIIESNEAWNFIDDEFSTKIYAQNEAFNDLNPVNMVADSDSDVSRFTYIWSGLEGTGLQQTNDGILSGDLIAGEHIFTLTVTDPVTEQTQDRMLTIVKHAASNIEWFFIDSEFSTRVIASEANFPSLDPQSLIEDTDSDVSTFLFIWSGLDETGLEQSNNGILSGNLTVGEHIVNLTVTDPATGQTDNRDLNIEKEHSPNEPWVFVESQFSDKFYQTTLPISPIRPQTLVSDSDSDVSTFTYSWSGLSEAGLTQDGEGVLTGSVREGRHILTVTVSDPNTTQTASHDLIVERQGSVYGICDPGTKKLIYRGSDADWRHCVTCNASPAGGVTSVKTFMENNDLSPSQKIFEINREIKPGDNWFAGRDFTNTSTGEVYGITVRSYVSYEGEVTFQSYKMNKNTSESSQITHSLSVSCPVTNAEWKFGNNELFAKRTYNPDASFEPIDPKALVTDRDSDVNTFTYVWTGLENTGLQQNAFGLLDGDPVEGNHVVTLTVTDPATGQTDSISLEIEREASPYGTCSADEQEFTTRVYGSDWKHCVKCAPAGSQSRGEVESITSFLYNDDHSPTLTEFNVGKIKKGYQASDRKSVTMPYYGNVTYVMEYRFSIHRQLKFYFTNYRTDGSGWLNSTPVKHRVGVNCPQ